MLCEHRFHRSSLLLDNIPLQQPRRLPFSSSEYLRCSAVHGPEVRPILPFASLGVVLVAGEGNPMVVEEATRWVEEERSSWEVEEVLTSPEEEVEEMIICRSSRVGEEVLKNRHC